MPEFEGKISVNFNEPALNALCAKYVTGFDPARFEIIAVRVFSGNEFIVTIYAFDKQSNTGTISEGKVPVKKFKLERVGGIELLEVIQAFNFTAGSGSHELDEMEVTNK
jgi:hypothetical protein